MAVSKTNGRICVLFVSKFVWLPVEGHSNFCKRLTRVRLLEKDSLEEASDFFFIFTTKYNCLMRDVL